MLVAPRVFASPADLGAAAAELVVDKIAARPAGAPFVLGCPGGRSPLTTYARLGQLAGQQQLDLSGLIIVMMDEYVVSDSTGGLVAVSAEQPHSCRGFAQLEIIDRLNRGLPRRLRIPAGNLWVPDPADPDAYERQLDQLGGVDVFLLASGASDGHVAFNPPGALPDSRTRVVELPESTRRDNLATFPSFGGNLAAVPRHGVTVGIATIRERSRTVVLIAHGPDKQQAVRRLGRAEGYEPDWPATVVADCRSPHLFVDQAALPSVPLPAAGALGR